jgi:hypothetical protein
LQRLNQGYRHTRASDDKFANRYITRRSGIGRLGSANEGDQARKFGRVSDARTRYG